MTYSPYWRRLCSHRLYTLFAAVAVPAAGFSLFSGRALADPSSPSLRKADGCPVDHRKMAGAGHSSEEQCPVDHTARQKVYNVYNTEIDPTNNMLANPNQSPAPGQAAPLST